MQVKAKEPFELFRFWQCILLTFIYEIKSSIRCGIAVQIKVLDIFIGAGVVSPFEVHPERLARFQTYTSPWNGYMHFVAFHPVFYRGVLPPTKPSQ